jgi:hypothetical protein
MIGKVPSDADPRDIARVALEQAAVHAYSRVTNSSLRAVRVSTGVMLAVGLGAGAIMLGLTNRIDEDMRGVRDSIEVMMRDHARTQDILREQIAENRSQIENLKEQHDARIRSND